MRFCDDDRDFSTPVHAKRDEPKKKITHNKITQQKKHENARASDSLKYPKHYDDIVQVAVDAARTSSRGRAKFAKITRHEHQDGPDNTGPIHVESVRLHEGARLVTLCTRNGSADE